MADLPWAGAQVHTPAEVSRSATDMARSIADYVVDRPITAVLPPTPTWQKPTRTGWQSMVTLPVSCGSNSMPLAEPTRLFITPLLFMLTHFAMPAFDVDSWSHCEACHWIRFGCEFTHSDHLVGHLR